jgi:hypothetical protein
MTGTGNTKAEANEELRKGFDRYKAVNRTLPRPGTRLAIEFADSNRVDRHAELAKDFTRRVLGLESAWISDSSSLWDFHGNEANDQFNEEILRIYGVDVSDISSGNLADIFERIANHVANE